MLNKVRNWKRLDAKMNFDEILDGARSGSLQRIMDDEGIYEITFTARGQERIVDVLARPGPDRD